MAIQWKRIRPVAGVETWLVTLPGRWWRVEREHEDCGAWLIVRCGNRSVQRWKTARAAKHWIECGNPVTFRHGDGYIEIPPL